MGARLGGERVAQKWWAYQNLELVQEAYELYNTSNAKLTWVRGHVGHEGNELADEWATRRAVVSVCSDC